MQKTFSLITSWVYRYGMKPLFFLSDPETVHVMLVGFGKTFSSVPVFRQLMKVLFAYQDPSLTKKLDGITFPNPIGLSAGFDYNADLVTALPGLGFGFHTIGTVTLEAYEGNPRPRLTRLPNSKSIIVNKGLKNIGAEAVIQKLADFTMEIPVGISIASTNRHFRSEKEQFTDIVECFKLFEASSLKHSYYELNISCPNTFGGEPFTTPHKLQKLMSQMDKLKLSRPLYVKMPIDQPESETLELLKVLEHHNAQGVIFGNLTKDKKNPDVDPRDLAIWKTTKGNLSGMPTARRSNRCIRLTKQHFGSRFTIIGTGGIFSAADAAQKMKLGADLLQLITGMIYEGPQVIGQINRELAERKAK